MLEGKKVNFIWFIQFQTSWKSTIKNIKLFWRSSIPSCITHHQEPPVRRKSKCVHFTLNECILNTFIFDFQLKQCRTYLGENLDPKFVRKNPLHTVPFLEDNGFYLTDSHAITQYLVETRAPASTFIGHTTKEKAVLNDRLYFDHFLFQKSKAVLVRKFLYLVKFKRILWLSFVL